MSGSTSCLKQKPHLLLLKTVLWPMALYASICVHLYTCDISWILRCRTARSGVYFLFCWIVCHSPRRDLCSHQPHISTCLPGLTAQRGSERSAKLYLCWVIGDKWCIALVLFPNFSHHQWTRTCHTCLKTISISFSVNCFFSLLLLLGCRSLLSIWRHCPALSVTSLFPTWSFCLMIFFSHVGKT